MTATVKPICWVPYYSAEITHMGTSPCCKIGPRANTPYTDLKSFSSPAVEQWRTDSFHGDQLLEQCNACRVPDPVFSYKTQNRRDFQKQGWLNPTRAELRKLIIGLDNICSSSCIQCGPHFSTTLGNLARKQSTVIPIYGPDYQVTPLSQLSLDQLDGCVSSLEILHLYGGEPLISPNLLPLLDLLAEQAPKFRSLTLSTGLCRIKPSHVAALAQLADRGVAVNCNVSLDGPQELNSWIRGITMEEFEQGWQLLLAHPKIKIGGFQTTIGIYNIFALPELIEEIAARWRWSTPPLMQSTVIHKPAQLNPRQLQAQDRVPTAARLQDSLAAAPRWARELLSTALHSITLDSTCAWPHALARLEAHPKWRGDTRSWQQWRDRYLLTD